MTRKPYSRNFQSKRLFQKFQQPFGEENNSEQQSLGLRISWTAKLLVKLVGPLGQQDSMFSLQWRSYLIVGCPTIKIKVAVEYLGLNLKRI
ncbi:hypothetical protein KY290_018408 [Solanum tuberosum]|uniref:Uncharacterized protein n=1 Tax=Solanum tuberosum TaxID=4113 RepID=A0ABQ7VE34_SOLTU|nr:hypothetical protein KY284_016966 [Solanum tuberosum]KAH0703077.1 hypothetical protein KY285_017355 [Solanum tuberosum]KAH0762335.1 hypothetical protein KY290_018408 [Solanum tuberosum]